MSAKHRHSQNLHAARKQALLTSATCMHKSTGRSTAHAIYHTSLQVQEARLRRRQAGEAEHPCSTTGATSQLQVCNHLREANDATTVATTHLWTCAVSPALQRVARLNFNARVG